MFDSLALIPVLLALGALAAAMLPRGTTAAQYKPWTEADFDIALRNELASQ